MKIFFMACIAGSLAVPGKVLADGAAGGAAPYLREGVGARGLGMGNAQAAACSDASSAYWNPAALTRLDGSGVASQTAILGEGRRWHFVNYAQLGKDPKAKRYAYGISWINFSAGNDIEERSSNRPDPERVFGDTQNTIFISAAGQPAESKTALGANVKILMHNLEDESAIGFGMDVAAWHDYGIWKAGLMCQDLYSTLNWSGRHTDRLPTLWRLGAEVEVVDNLLCLAADGTLEFSHAGAGVAQAAYHMGAECTPYEWLILRAGLDQGRWTAGVGFKVLLGSRFWGRLDYAVAGEQLPGAGPTHLFSLILDVPSVGPAEP